MSLPMSNKIRYLLRLLDPFDRAVPGRVALKVGATLRLFLGLPASLYPFLRQE